ncbi:hypothetical protein [Selenomonas ruminantium]|uniref:Uncharacterized protein n=1 Tax=Selenomonas ruminantium TaxID=971 RepID=A0A1H3XGA9_SELRU|nr:hypothetical protein [Selenomonas ruminantium]SDZ98427.1 hypothetical protein SAMN05660648_01498 [Selenomonas ruminantium]
MGADRALSRKGKLLYDYIQEKGGGALEEWRIRDKTGLSHGSICAARKELVTAGLLVLGKDVRKTTYTLRDLTSQKCPLTPIPAITPPPPARAVLAPVTGKKSKPRKKAAHKAARTPAEVQEAIMPRVTGDFPDFDSWLLALNETLGDCVDVSQSLVDEQEYIVFADAYGEDSYIITDNEDGGISVE